MKTLWRNRKTGHCFYRIRLRYVVGIEDVVDAFVETIGYTVTDGGEPDEIKEALKELPKNRTAAERLVRSMLERFGDYLADHVMDYQEAAFELAQEQAERWFPELVRDKSPTEKI